MTAGHGIVAAGNVEADRSQPVIHVRQQAEVALPGDPARHVAQFFAGARRIHVENYRRERSRPIRAGGERPHAPVLCRDHDVLFEHLLDPPQSLRQMPHCHAAAADLQAGRHER